MPDRWTRKLTELLAPHRPSEATPSRRLSALVIGPGLPPGWADPVNALCRIRTVGDPEEALEVLQFEDYDLILIPIEGLTRRPLEVVAAIRAYRATPIFVVGTPEHADLLAEALRAGADDYLPADRPTSEVLLLLEHALARCDLLRRGGEAAAVQRDFLTGLVTPEAFQQAYRRALARRRQFGERLGLIRVDLLNLGGIYAAYGGVVGDRAVQEVARILRERVRRTDTVARLGQDRFAVLLVGATRERVAWAADQISQALHNLRFPEHPDLRVPFRVGWSVPEGEEDPLEAAEGSLRQAV